MLKHVKSRDLNRVIYILYQKHSLKLDEKVKYYDVMVPALYRVIKLFNLA